MAEKTQTIAIVGAGAAGLTAAYLLQKRYDVTVFEKAAQAGGYAQTWTLPGGPDKGLSLELGLVAFCERNEPTFVRLLDQLGVARRPTEWSFAFWDEKTDLRYALEGWPGLFTQWRAWGDPRFITILRERARFHSRLQRDHQAGRLGDTTLGAYLVEGRYSPVFLQDHLAPFVAVLWSISVKEVLDLPAALLARHLSAYLPHQRHQWSRVEGGSQAYIKALLAKLRVPVRSGEAVEEVKRRIPPAEAEIPFTDTEALRSRVVLRTRDGKEQAFDKVVLACHADEALALLADPSEDEQRLLSLWRYQKNHVMVHTDAEIMPTSLRSWAVWNYCRERETTKAEPLAATCDLNRALGLGTRERYFLTLNRIRPVPAHHILKEAYFTHPVPSLEAVRTQGELRDLNGRRLTYYCGGYFGDGFHEDAVRSGMEVARALGVEL